MGLSVFPAPASGPTLAEITTAGNSAGWGTVKGPVDTTWTNIASQTGNGATTVTFSSISGYRMLKLVVTGLAAGAGNLNVTFNGDSGGNYSSLGYRSRDNASGFLQPIRFHNSTSLHFGMSDSGNYEGHLIIEDATSTTAHKQLSAKYAGFDGAQTFWDIQGVYRSNSAITSISITRGAGGTWASSSPAGFYLYGAN